MRMVVVMMIKNIMKCLYLSLKKKNKIDKSKGCLESI